LHNKYSHTQYTNALREVLGDPVMSSNINYPAISQNVPSASHPRTVNSISEDLDRNANNMFQDVMTAAEGGDGDDVLYSQDSVPMNFRQQMHGGNGIGITADVPNSNMNDKYVFPELDIPTLNLKTIKTPSAQLQSLIDDGPSRNTEDIDELLKAYRTVQKDRTIENVRGDEWDALTPITEHTTPSVADLIEQAEAAMSDKPVKSHFNSAGLEGTLSLIDESPSRTNPYVISHHQTTHTATPRFTQHHKQAQKGDKEQPTVADGANMSVEQLQKMARKTIQGGAKIVASLQKFQETMAPQLFTHNLLHTPVVHHHHQPSHASSLLEVSEGAQAEADVEAKVGADKTSAFFSAAARRVTEDAENGIDELLDRANDEIDNNKIIVKDLGKVHSKIVRIQKEYNQLRKSDASDIASMQAEEALMKRIGASKPSAPAVSLAEEETHEATPAVSLATPAEEETHEATPAVSLAEEETHEDQETSLLDVSKRTHHGKGARRMREKLNTRMQRHKRRKHRHSH